MSIVKELEKVLVEEQQHLLNGDFDGLEALIARKTKLAERLKAKKPDMPKGVYEDLAKKAAHNEALLGAARRGLQAAMTHLKQSSDGEAQKTYSKEGQRQSLTQRPSSMVQKF